MTRALEVVVWASLAVQIYHYLLYPILLALLARVRPRPVRRRPITPRVTLVVAAYQEAGILAEKLENSLALDYPDLQVVVSAGGSTDGTEAIARRYAAQGVITLDSGARRGKVAAINRAVEAADGEIVVLSDANAIYARDALRELVQAFADPEIGCVCGTKVVRSAPSGGTAASGEGLYWKLENALKKLESRIGSSVAVNGEMMAVRRADWTPIPTDVINDDAFLALRTMASGRRVAYEPRAVCHEDGSSRMAEDGARRRRMTAGRWQLLLRGGLLPWARPLDLLLYVSHKALRLVLPLFLVATLAGSGLLVATGDADLPMRLLLAGQLAFYALAAQGALAEARGRRWKPAQIAWYFTAGHLSSLAGLVRHLGGAQGVLWEKVAR